MVIKRDHAEFEIEDHPVRPDDRLMVEFQVWNSTVRQRQCKRKAIVVAASLDGKRPCCA